MPSFLRTVAHSQNAAFVFFAAASLSFCFAPRAPAASLEQVYQRALEDPEFKSADEELNAAYSRGMRTLPKEERDKLRQAERFWIRENQELLLQNPQREVEVLKQRFLKRRDELLLLKAESETSVSPAAPAAVPPPETKGSGAQGVWTEKAAVNLERVYQAALQDPAFETADSSLRALFKEAVAVLSAADSEKLKPAQKAWVRENAVLVAADPGRAQTILGERVAQRRNEILRMLDRGRFEPAAAASAPPLPPPQSAASVATARQPSLPEPVIKEPPIAAPAPAQTAPAPAELQESVAAAPGSQTKAGFTQVFWALLATWILGLGFFHYRAFGQKQKRAVSHPQPPLNVKGLYLATGTGLLVSLMPLVAAPSALTAIVGILFTVVGLGTAKIAAEEWARGAAKNPAKPLEAQRQQAALAQPALQKAVRPASGEAPLGEAALVPAELQTARQGNYRKGNRQKRRRK
jgi:uncharacterized protein YecT (DUF1311 family)